MADAAKNEDVERSIGLISSTPLPFIHMRMRIAYYLYPRFLGIRTRRIGFNTLVKFGARVDLAEAYTMSYISNHTSIPVPKVQRAWRSSEGITYIVMEFVSGVELGYAWRNMSQDIKDWVIVQLKDYVQQLRALDPPSDGAVTSVVGGPLRDGSRIGLEQFGPFRNYDDFHQFLRADITLDSFGPLQEKGVIVSHRQQYQTKFTHGDLAPRNIMVKKDGTITAIVDWDSAGWFPEYWEYTKANFSPHAPDDWVSRIGEITGRYDEQLAGERQLYTLCGCMLT